jgi:hypothetical protein
MNPICFKIRVPTLSAKNYSIEVVLENEDVTGKMRKFFNVKVK